MKKEYTSPLFEKFLSLPNDYCTGGASSVNPGDLEDNYGSNVGEADNILD